MEIIIPDLIGSSETKEYKDQLNFSMKILAELKSHNYYIESFYLSTEMSRTIFITSLENVINEEFINLFYKIANQFEELFRNENDSYFYFSFIGNKNINEEELEIDGFKKYIT